MVIFILELSKGLLLLAFGITLMVMAHKMRKQY